MRKSAVAVLLLACLVLVACSQPQVGETGGASGVQGVMRKCGADVSVLNAVTHDRTTLSDTEISTLAEDFISSWRTESDTVINDPTLSKAAFSELVCSGFAPYSDIGAVYLPRLKAVMILGGGGKLGTVFTSDGTVVADGLATYATPGVGQWIINPETEADYRSRKLVLKNCSIGHVIRTGSGSWTGLGSEGAVGPGMVRDFLAAGYTCPFK